MEKSRLGISVGVVAAVVYLAGLLDGFVLLLVAAFYVLFCEQNEWLRKSADKAVILYLAFAVIGFVLGLIGDVFGVVFDFIRWVTSFVTGYSGSLFSFSLTGLLRDLVYFVRGVLFLILALLAFKQKTISFGPLDRAIDKQLS